MILSKRLQMIADLIPKCDIVADVGTDHGFLAAWILENHIAQRVFATDIHAGPLSRAKQTAEEHGLSERMECHLCDGLQFPGAEAADAVIIAGMGGETMISILQAAPWCWQNKALILQPQSKHVILYQWLAQHSIVPQKAKLCTDTGKRYLAFLASGSESAIQTVDQLLYEQRDPLFPEYVDAELQRLHTALDGMRSASRNLKDHISDLEQQIFQYEQYRKAVQSW